MRLSQFNVYIEAEPEPGRTLVYNTFSGAYVVLDDETVEVLRRADREERLSREEEAIAKDPELHDPDVGIMVPSHACECAELEAWLEKRRARDVLEVTVAVNRACNFACSYCCQAKVLDGAVMSQEVAEQVGDWLASRAVTHGLSAIELTFVGGEPLLHPSRIRQIARGVARALAGAEVSFSFRVTTNGSLLTPVLVDDLAKLGLRRATVTLDGDEKTHGRTRLAKNGKNTFFRVFGNAIEASKRIGVAINGNYCADTLAGFVPLLRKLAAAGLPPGSTVCFSPALEALGVSHGGDSDAHAWDKEDAATQVALYDATLRHGFEPLPLDVVGPCQFHDRHRFAVDVDGALHACPGLFGHLEWALGDVLRGPTRRSDELGAATAIPDACGGCAHLPVCGGGCVASRLLSADGAGDGHCASGYLTEVQREAARRAIGLCSPSSDEGPRPTGLARDNSWTEKHNRRETR